MGKFMVLVKGTGYTSHVHETLDSAVTEGKRLFNERLGKMGEVQILEIVGTIRMEEVPVVKKEMVIHLQDRLKNSNQEDDLPF